MRCNNGVLMHACSILVSYTYLNVTPAAVKAAHEYFVTAIGFCDKSTES
jgi:hypothetical protein